MLVDCLRTLAIGLALALPSASPVPKKVEKASPPPPSLPIDFRCDSMRVLSKPNRTICEHNVVLRRGPLILCCQRFEGDADASWNWTRFVCRGDVRSLRNDELVWSDLAEFAFATDDLVLTGDPHLARGPSVLVGERVVINTLREHARLEKPRGSLQSAVDSTAGQPTATDQPPPPPRVSPDAYAKMLKSTLPDKCPLPPHPSRDASHKAGPKSSEDKMPANAVKREAPTSPGKETRKDPPPSTKAPTPN